MCREADLPGLLGHPRGHRPVLGGYLADLASIVCARHLPPGLAGVPPTNQDSSSPAVGRVRPCLGAGVGEVGVAVPDVCSPVALSLSTAGRGLVVLL